MRLSFLLLPLLSAASVSRPETRKVCDVELVFNGQDRSFPMTGFNKIKIAHNSGSSKDIASVKQGQIILYKWREQVWCTHCVPPKSTVIATEPYHQTMLTNEYGHIHAIKVGKQEYNVLFLPVKGSLLESIRPMDPSFQNYSAFKQWVATVADKQVAAIIYRFADDYSLAVEETLLVF